MPHEYLSLEKENSPAFYPHWLQTRKTGKKNKKCLFFFSWEISTSLLTYCCIEIISQYRQGTYSDEKFR